MSEITICPECAEKMIEIPVDSLGKDSREGIIQAFYCGKCDVAAYKLKNPQGLDAILSEILGHPENGDWDKHIRSEKYLGKYKSEQVKGRTGQKWGKMLEKYACSYLAENLMGWELKRGDIIGNKEYDCLGWKGETKYEQSPDLAIEMHFPFPKNEQSYYLKQIKKRTDKMVRKLEGIKAGYKYILIGIPRNRTITTYEQEHIKRQTGIKVMWQEHKFSKIKIEKRKVRVMTESLNLNHSSKSEQTTRVKFHRKQARIKVGITLKPLLLTEARKRNLNISRITEQALESILDYVLSQKNDMGRWFSLV
jgi:hypothetical protein